MAKPDGVIVPGDVVKRNRHKKVLNHNYLPLLTQGTPSFIKKETAHKCAGINTNNKYNAADALQILYQK